MPGRGLNNSLGFPLTNLISNEEDSLTVSYCERKQQQSSKQTVKV